MNVDKTRRTSRRQEADELFSILINFRNYDNSVDNNVDDRGDDTISDKNDGGNDGSNYHNNDKTSND